MADSEFIDAFNDILLPVDDIQEARPIKKYSTSSTGACVFLGCHVGDKKTNLLDTVLLVAESPAR